MNQQQDLKEGQVEGPASSSSTQDVSDSSANHPDLSTNENKKKGGKGRIAIVAAICVVVIAGLAGTAGNSSSDAQPESPQQQKAEESVAKDDSPAQESPTQDSAPAEPDPVEAYKGGLNKAIEDYAVNDLTLFTDPSAAEYEKALTNAAAIADNAEATQADVDSAESALREAYNGLEIKFDESNYQAMNYKNVARDPDAYEGMKLKCTGRVLQVSEGDSETDVRLATDGDYDDVVLVGFDPAILDVRVLEDDELTVYGICIGLYTYTAVLGNEISVPAIYADKVVIE